MGKIADANTHGSDEPDARDPAAHGRRPRQRSHLPVRTEVFGGGMAIVAKASSVPSLIGGRVTTCGPLLAKPPSSLGVLRNDVAPPHARHSNDSRLDRGSDKVRRPIA